jgi:phage-related protein
MRTERKIVFHADHFVQFYLMQNAKVQEKIEYVFKIVRTVEKIPKKFLDHLTGTEGIYEMRIEVGSDIYGIFCCFDDGNLVVLFNAFQKKTQKTPKQELDKAVRLKKEYFNIKNKKK